MAQEKQLKELSSPEMARKGHTIRYILLSVVIIAALLKGNEARTQVIYTADDEEYMRKQAAKFFVQENPVEDYINHKTGAIALKELSKAGMSSIVVNGTESNQQKQIAANAESSKQQPEHRNDITSFKATAALDWGIPETIIPSVEETAWGRLQQFQSVPQKTISYELLSRGTEIKIALLTNRIDLPEGVIGQITLPVCNSKGKEIISQSTLIYGYYSFDQQAIVWEKIKIDGNLIQLENREEMLSVGLSLSEEYEPGYRLSIHVNKAILIKIPSYEGAEFIE